MNRPWCGPAQVILDGSLMTDGMVINEFAHPSKSSHRERARRSRVGRIGSPVSCHLQLWEGRIAT